LQQESQSRGAATPGNKFLCANLTMIEVLRQRIGLEEEAELIMRTSRFHETGWKALKPYIRIVPEPN